MLGMSLLTTVMGNLASVSCGSNWDVKGFLSCSMSRWNTLTPAGPLHTLVTGHPQGITESGLAQMEGLGRDPRREAQQGLRVHCDNIDFPSLRGTGGT